MHKLLLTGLLISLLTGCGFQLRGTIDLPTGIEPFYISSSNVSDPLYLELLNIFNANELRLSTTPAEANYRLVIGKQKSDRRSTSVGNDGRIAEYQLIESVSFLIKDKQGATASGPTELTERRILQNDPNRVISTESEERLIRTEMKKSLARKLTRQLSNFDYQAYEAQQTASNSDAS